MSVATIGQGRAAGSGTHYDFALLRNGEPDLRTKISLPSVTTILQSLNKPVLVNWAAKVTREGVATLLASGELPEDADGDTIHKLLKERGLRHMDQRDSAATRGTNTHSLLENLCHGLPVDPGDDPFAQGLCKWWETRKPLVVDTERPVYSLTHGYAGTADLVLNESGDPFGAGPLTLADLKTRKRRQPAWETDYMQTAAYALAYSETTRLDVGRTMVLVVRDDGSYEEFYGNPERDIEPFLALKRVWDWQQAQNGVMR